MSNFVSKTWYDGDKVYGSDANRVEQILLDLATEVDDLSDKIDDAIDATGSASESADNSADSATLSESWAIGGTGTRDGEDTNNAKYYAEQSKASASESAVSATDAETSATESASSATESKASAEAAATSETNAAASAEAASESASILNELGLSVVDGCVCQTYEDGGDE